MESESEGRAEACLSAGGWTWCRTLWLPGRVVDLQVEGLRVGALHHGDVVARPLVGLGQRVGPPVGPVDLASVHGDGEGMGQILVTPQHFNQPRAVVHGGVDGV